MMERINPEEFLKRKCVYVEGTCDDYGRKDRCWYCQIRDALKEEGTNTILAANIYARVEDDTVVILESGIPRLRLTSNAAAKLAEELIRLA